MNSGTFIMEAMDAIFMDVCEPIRQWNISILDLNGLWAHSLVYTHVGNKYKFTNDGILLSGFNTNIFGVSNI